MPCEGWIQILPQGILESKGLKKFDVQFSMANELPVIFGNSSAIGFDIFGAIFYCLSRYEEYKCLEFDRHSRFSYLSSFLHVNNYLQTPLVDYWVAFFKSYLIKMSTGPLPFKEKATPAILPTIDVDSIFTYQGKDIVRQLGGFAKDLIGGQWPQIKRRLSVLSGRLRDPFDNFDYQFEILKSCNLKANYFIQVGKNGAYDKNINPHNKAFQTLLKRMVKEGHEVGLHPSYQSFGEEEIIQKEKQLLERIIERPVIQSRQHYLRFSLPSTYLDLVQLGIKKEFSMGYSEVPGYRASTSKPFFWYDLEMENMTELEIIPFSMMDVAFKEFMRMTIDETLQYSDALREQIIKVNGSFSFVFHNESLSDLEGWKGWRTVFEKWLTNEHKTH
ncbi:MAG: polysaccharide deacetylase family protein [bacterium]|nr:polysaccharide deacetylase family protein [bacterium]